MDDMESSIAGRLEHLKSLSDSPGSSEQLGSQRWKVTAIVSITLNALLLFGLVWLVQSQEKSPSLNATGLEWLSVQVSEQTGLPLDRARHEIRERLLPAD